MSVIVGDPIPLWAQLYDGKDGLRVVAKLFSDKGQQLGQRVLVHFGNGLYLNQDFPMPEGVEHVIAQYSVFRGTQPVDDYELIADIYYAVQPEKEEPKFAVGVIIDETKETGTGRVINEASVIG